MAAGTLYRTNDPGAQNLYDSDHKALDNRILALEQRIPAAQKRVAGQPTAYTPVIPTGGGSGGGSTSSGGTVTNFSAAVPSWLSAAVTNPSTTPNLAITATAGLAANSFLATPDGATGPLGVRQIVTGDFPASGVTAGAYTNTNLTVDATGRITAAANGSSGGSVTLAGDVTGSSSANTISKIGGVTYTALSPVDGYAIIYNAGGSTLRLAMLGGDCQGSLEANTVTAIRNQAWIAATSDGQIPIWSAAGSEWIPTLPPATRERHEINSSGTLVTRATTAIRRQMFFIDASGGNLTLTLPPVSANYDSAGIVDCDIYVSRVDASLTTTVTVTAGGGDNISGQSSLTLLAATGGTTEGQTLELTTRNSTTYQVV